MEQGGRLSRPVPPTTVGERAGRWIASGREQVRSILTNIYHCATCNAFIRSEDYEKMQEQIRLQEQLRLKE